MENKQRMVMQNVINLSKPINNTASSSNESQSIYKTPQARTDQQIECLEEQDNDWQIQRRNSRQYCKSRTGRAQDKNGKFRGVKPKVWMYLYRVEPDVLEQDIIEYLKEKTGKNDDDLIVKELKGTGRYKEYMVAADFALKNEFYNPNFWPNGVKFNRFDFDLHKQKIKENESDTRPGSFLVKERIITDEN